MKKCYRCGSTKKGFYNANDGNVYCIDCVMKVNMQIKLAFLAVSARR